MATNSSKSKNNSNSRGKTAATKKRTVQSKKSSSNKNNVTKEQYKFYNEIYIVAGIAVSLLFLLSSFGVIGKLGGIINTVTFGTLGVIAYIFPFTLMFGVFIIAANKGNVLAKKKFIYALILLCFMASLVSLFASEDDIKLSQTFTYCASYKSGGGFIGQLICNILTPFIGFWGSLIVLIAIITILVILISEKLIITDVFSAITNAFKRWQEYRDYEYEDEYYDEISTKSSTIRNQNIRKPAKTFVFETTKTDENKKSKASLEEVSGENFVPKKKARKKKKGEQFITTPAGMKELEAAKVGLSFIDDSKNNDINKIPEEFIDTDTGEIYEQELFKKFGNIHNDVTSDITVDSSDNAGDISSLAQEVDNILSEDANSFNESNNNDVFEGSTSLDNSHISEQNDFNDKLNTDNFNTSNFNISEDNSATLNDDESYGNDINSNTTQDNISSNNTLQEKIETNNVQNNNEKNSVKNVSQNASQTKTAGATPNDTQNSASANIPAKYKFPPLNLLTLPKGGIKTGVGREHKMMAQKLQSTLKSFGVNVTITDISVGPTVTRYEIQPEQGVKVSKITNLTDDIKLNLAATDIRIEAPIPGKAAVGIEVPNKENSAVLLRELFESPQFKDSKSSIAFAVGKDLAGQPVVTDIAKMPHLLIAGQTGSGKSVCINTLIMSIIYKYHPDDVKLIMIDPKVVELSVYNGIPHLLIPVVTDPKKASGALNWAVQEMVERYNKFAELGVRDMKGYNNKISSVKGSEEAGYEPMPQIVIIVDELADLMMVAPGEVEDAICRLAQMARAAGIHLIIATQRPSVNVITGLIKANIPSRIAFSVASAIDSRTILDGGGAEKLLGKGDMLFYPSGYPKPVRLQGAFVSDSEVSDVVDFLSGNNSNEYNNDIISKIETTASSMTSSSVDKGTNDRDQYFAEAGRFIIEKDKASIGMLQRVYKIGFNRAARIMDQLCDAGVVGPEEGTKPRKVLMSKEEFEKYIEEYV